jgi:uncharacterized protein
MLLTLAAAAPAVSCGAGSLGQAVRPEDKTAADALGEEGAACTKAPKKGEPLVVDWKTNEQLELTVAMQKSVAVVAYDCKSIKLLKDCSIQGGYGFTAVPSVLQETVKIEDADEVQASMPLGGATLGGEVKRGAAIDIGLAYVGKRKAMSASVAKSELVGDCDGATHFVRGATIGAFAMETGTKGEVRAAAEIFGASAKAASTSNKKKLNSAGDLSACKAVKDGAEAPPEGCAAVVRLDLLAIDSGPPDATAGPAPLENTCPEGYVPGAGRCVKKGRGTAYRCDPKNLTECKDQCQKGDAESCFNMATLLQTGAQIGGPEEKEYVPVYQKACDSNGPNVADACGRLGYIYALSPNIKNWERALTYGKKGCDLMSVVGCLFLAREDKQAGWPERAKNYKKACTLGDAGGCMEAALIDVEGRGGTPRNTAAGLKALDGACTAGEKEACAQLYALYDKGKTRGGAATDVATDPARRDGYKKKFCARGGKGMGIRCE